MVFILFHNAKIERIYPNSRAANIGYIRFPPRMIGGCSGAVDSLHCASLFVSNTKVGVLNKNSF